MMLYAIERSMQLARAVYSMHGCRVVCAGNDSVMAPICCSLQPMGLSPQQALPLHQALPLLLGLFPAVAVPSPAAASQLVWSVMPAPWAEPQPAPSPRAAVPIPVAAASAVGQRVETRSQAAQSQVASQPAAVTAAPAVAPSSAASSNASTKTTPLRESLRIPPLVARRKPWPAPSLSPGVPSSFIANWGDVFIGASAATAGKQRGGTADGSWSAGFGIGDAAKAVAVELSGGCGSVNNFCANGSFDVKVSRLLINESTSRLALSAAWQNFAQWGNEGRQDNTFYGGLTYAMPLDPGNKAFERTLQINAGVGNSRYAPYTATDSESQIGAFASIGVELAPNVGISAGWSGRGANAQFSITPFREVPISVNLLGADLFNQTPAGTVGVLSISWGANFRTARFD